MYFVLTVEKKKQLFGRDMGRATEIKTKCKEKETYLKTEE